VWARLQKIGQNVGAVVHRPSLALDAEHLKDAPKVACDPAIDLDIDLIPLGHATLKLLKLYLKRRGTPAMRKHGLGHVIAAARVRDMQLDDVFPPPRPRAATVAAHGKTRRPFVTLLLTVANRGVARALMLAENFGGFHTPMLPACAHSASGYA
jgi:hypothetical protein